MATLTQEATYVASDVQELLLYRRIAWRILPLTIVCFLFSYFDRINISFAKTQMQAELGLSDAAYGFAASIFFFGYVMFEVPSSYGLKKYGAPSWICRIMVSWGIATACLVFAYNEYTLYFLRFLIGVMEAGFGPALLFYLACWFPKKNLASMNGIWFLSIPLSGVLGAPVSGGILEYMNGFLGLAGWHWLFVLSGLPCALLGVIVLYKLDRDIQSAKWLTQPEKDLLQRNLDNDRKDAKPIHASLLKVILTREVAVLSAIYFMVKLTGYGLNFWMPHLIGSSGVNNQMAVGFLTALPYLVAAIGMIFVTRRSDATGERKRYLWQCMLVGGIGYFAACYFNSNHYLLTAFLVLATAGVFIAIPIFWTIPQKAFAGLAIAGGIAAINTVGQLSGMVAPLLVGYINDLTGNTYMGMLALAPFCLICAAVILWGIPNDRKTA
ncbi:MULTISPECIES: MFS transporter [unclassified Pseudomonas]|uniref:MFS transporter n=1 Tax=Pseudomonas TaxID=286 RepID=UPI000D0124A6|nr:MULTISPECIES: MFS transporter [unclassified Pseudomonas]PRN02670.1 MFS transporter permease [Pseudomonas sp. LLC-1]PYG79632.1 sugar phosphate permease [Pseudomonas sp. RV120224-01c]PYG83864.1 sugar phosphate permease [Pseudomonas sp. RV120224-01b]